MEIAKLIVDLIGKIIWPMVIMTIVMIFRKPIINRFQYITNVKGGGIEVSFEKKIAASVEEVLDEKLEQPDTSPKLKAIMLQQEGNIENIVESDNSNDGNRTLLAFTANRSYRENLKYNIYYDPVFRSHNSAFKYIGLYKDGEVFAVGKLMKIVCCDYKNEEIIATNGDDLKGLTNEESNRIKDIIKNTDYYELEEGLKFFLVDNFYLTHYAKSTPYPIRAKKYFWLDEVEGFKEGMTAEQLSKLLDGKTWE